MKTQLLRARTRLMLAVAAGSTLAMVPTVCQAGDPTAPAKPEVRAESTKAPKSCCSSASTVRKKHQGTPEKVTLTGSLIPQNVKPKDANLVSTAPITVIDRKMIDASGSATLSGVLRKNVAGAR